MRAVVAGRENAYTRLAAVLPDRADPVPALAVRSAPRVHPVTLAICVAPRRHHALFATAAEALAIY
ncbi:hypothetical protein HYG77_04870 [Rhodococcus sp. ZPP]|uniref:hypothetical protein n=1 Tax=Rhodococcus sp. ZPP TaxID=2749906 RepID=UPI001AD859FD|nr:hypothetical protein [Rhodococcus sp. ZPP]QTJ64996.1 hypothetical protein HYG77_04870 [Rhodococcus sp. ZPP]